MWIVLPVDAEGEPDDDGVFPTATGARLECQELNREADDDDPLFAVFELREVG